jgi:predicted Zn-dependent protease
MTSIPGGLYAIRNQVKVMYLKKLNIPQLFVMLVGILCAGSASAQTKVSREEAKRVLSAYKERSHVFMNLETCGSAFDGPAYVMKQTENYSLDHMFNITQAQQQELGARIFEADQAGIVMQNDRRLPMLRELVARLVSYSANPKLNYHVYILRSEQINAYSTIGGYIYVTDALLNFVNSKDELAFVLGHELTHILENHVVRKEKKIALLTYVGQKMNMKEFSSVALNLDMTLSAPFDQIDEYEADRGGLELVKKAGYDENAFNAFFLKLEKYDRQDLLSRFTSTHPSSAHRRRCLNKLIGK